MRPGQAAPEFVVKTLDDISQATRFNEAGAGCPGIPFAEILRLPRFGKASMRPGQAAPEFSLSYGIDASQHERFNEAGAGCPGIHVSVWEIVAW